MDSLILSIVILLFVGLCFYGIYHLVGKRWPNTGLQVIVGIALILILIIIGLHLFGVKKFASMEQEKMFPLPHKPTPTPTPVFVVEI